MGLFDQITAAYGGAFSAARVDEAQRAADGMLRASGVAGGIAGVAGMGAADMAAGMADRSAIESQAHEQNRILRIGAPVELTIDGHIDTGERAGGNPVWLLELTVRRADGSTYSTRLRQIVSTAALGGYADGTVSPGRVDPADPDAIAFGSQPWM